ncbi:MAG: enoyl-CoA hydratase/isomerase family protein [Chitinophagaceae bacterium]|nr:enoyl-CoA hydratase/isomerase family protein [Chitinophagaceae bacterium]
MDYTTILFEVTDGICTITINRPDKLNALNKTVFDELDNAMDRVYADDSIKGVIITGQGTKAFVAGADISEFLSVPEEKGAQLADRGQQVFFKIEDCPKPVIAAVNGFALGGGCELAMACHLRIASNNARFGQPEVNLGLIPGYGGTQRLTALIGKGKAMELMLTGAMIGADQALNLGLVNEVTTPEELIEKTTSMLKVIMSKSPVAVAKAIKAVNAFNHTRGGFAEETRLFGEAFRSEDMKEGTAAFLEKRAANFPGK